MKCSDCNQNEANFKYTQVINGKKKELNLCSSCAYDLGYFDSFNSYYDSFNIGNFLSGFINNIPEYSRYSLEGEEECPLCKNTYNDFLNSGKFGCAKCYDTFKNEIGELLKKIQGSKKYLSDGNNNIEAIDKHNGDKVIDKNKDEIDKLEIELKEAIEIENYEHAAVIRDKIKDLKKGV